jgi:hypothetical protein
VVLAGLGLVPALVLLWSGWSKLRDPAPVSAALVALRLPHGPVAARSLGATEAVLGAAVLAATPVTWAALALWYSGLLVAAIALRRTPVASCGCFGADSPRAGLAHVVTNLAAAALATTAALAGAPGVVELAVDEGLWPAAVLAGYGLLAAWLVVVLLRDLPAVGRTEAATVRAFEVTTW